MLDTKQTMSKKLSLTLIITFGLIAISSLISIVYTNFFRRFDILHVSSTPNFSYKDSLSCKVVYSTYQNIGETSFQYFNVREFTLRNLNTNNPQIEQDGSSSTMEKIQEGSAAVTFQKEQSSTPDGYSVEVLQVDKSQGTFVRTFMGFGQYFGPREKFYPDGFQYVIAEKGRCE